jgi:hypothetical protein
LAEIAEAISARPCTLLTVLALRAARSPPSAPG